MPSCRRGRRRHRPDDVHHRRRRGPGSVFVAVHLEVDTFPRTVEPWPRVVELVDRAERNGSRLTLMFSAPWARYAADRVSPAKCAAGPGHEISLHHHGPSRDFLDGYTEDPSAVAAPHRAVDGYLARWSTPSTYSPR